MIHIATNHINDPRWIDIQRRYFEAHLTEEFRVYAFLTGLHNFRDHMSKFHYVSPEPVGWGSTAEEQKLSHAVKLNLLSDIINICSSDDRDLLIFIDGDAFPIADVASFAAHRWGSIRSWPSSASRTTEISSPIPVSA